ncbi:hypothetical protein SDC9_145723 [bioreactor metagenome]|uniref:Uncharacterized protein n=1 Tax=bioreactor metagenome TaxID=1076179 RepID=A0A645EAQ4_9ZZZZ
MDITVFKPYCGGTEDKIGSTLYITTVKIEPGIFSSGIEGILITQERAVFQNDPVTFGVQCHRLCYYGRIVYDGDIFQCDVVAPDLHGICPESTHVVDQCMIVVGDDGFFPALTHDFEVAHIVGNDDLLIIGTLLDEDRGNIVRIESSHSINGLLQRGKITFPTFVNHKTLLLFCCVVSFIFLHNLLTVARHQMFHPAVEIYFQEGVPFVVQVRCCFAGMIFIEPSIGDAVTILIAIKVVDLVFRPSPNILLAVDEPSGTAGGSFKTV